MKPEPPPLRVATPCPKNWSDMSGDAKRRFCGHCQLHVHNLSAMPAGERAQFVAETRGHACITYELRPDGTMVTASRWDWVLGPLRALVTLLAALIPFAYSSCASRMVKGGIKCDPATQTVANKRGNMPIVGEASPIAAPKKPGNTVVMGTPAVPKAPDKGR